MTAFRDDNAEGYTTAELAVLNDAMALLMGDVGDDDLAAQLRKSYAGMLHNTWEPGMTAEELADAVLAPVLAPDGDRGV